MPIIAMTAPATEAFDIRKRLASQVSLRCRTGPIQFARASRLLRHLAFETIQFPRLNR
jgi:hypothetical protein